MNLKPTHEIIFDTVTKIGKSKDILERFNFLRSYIWINFLFTFLMTNLQGKMGMSREHSNH